MSEFQVTPSRLKSESGTVKGIAKKLNKMNTSIDSVIQSLSGISGGSYGTITSSLRTIMQNIEQLRQVADAMGDVLEETAAEYTKTEKKIAKTVSLSSKVYLQGESGGSVLNADADARIEGDVWKRKAIAEAGASVATGNFKLDFEDGFYTLEGSGTALGADANAYAGYNIAPGNLEAYAGAAAAAYGLKGELNQSALWGLSKFSASGEVLSASASATAYASLMHNGIYLPSAGIEGKAGASVASGQVKETFGADKFNTHVGAEGSVLSAKAEASAKFGAMQEGNGEISYGAEAKVEAGAYLAKGEVSGGFTLFGIEIDASLGGKVGVGVEAGVDVSSDSVGVDLGLAALLGVDVELNIDWSNFGW